MVVVADFMLEGSGMHPCWTGDRVLGEHAAFCVCRWVGMVENGCLCGTKVWRCTRPAAVAALQHPDGQRTQLSLLIDSCPKSDQVVLTLTTWN